MTRWLIVAHILALGFLSSLQAQPPSPPGNVKLPKAVYAPRPVYRPEWAKKGLAGKGVVLVTIDPKNGNVTGVKMEQSTGNALLDGAAMQAYSQWRFEPGSVPQLKIPIEFKARPPSQAFRPNSVATPYVLVIAIGFAAVVMAILKRKRT
jgi:TonB family protein